MGGSSVSWSQEPQGYLNLPPGLNPTDLPAGGQAWVWAFLCQEEILLRKQNGSPSSKPFNQAVTRKSHLVYKVSCSAVREGQF